MQLTDAKAITVITLAIVTAAIGVLVAAGLPLSKNLTDAIIQLITVVTPVVVAAVGLLHHSSTKARALLAAQQAPAHRPHRSA